MRLSPLDPLNRGFMGGLAVAHLIARRYQEAVEWADQSLATQPDYRPALRVKVAALVQLGRIDKARDWLKRLIEVQPGLTITRIEAYGGGALLTRTARRVRRPFSPSPLAPGVKR